MSFLELNQQIGPETIVSDQDKAFASAISELKSEGILKSEHLLDRWHFLRTLKESKSNLFQFSELLNSSSKREYQSKFNEMLSSLSGI